MMQTLVRPVGLAPSLRLEESTGRASQPRGQVPAALQSMSREGAGTSAGGATGAALQGQPGAPGSQQASSSRQGSGATAAPSRCLAHSLWTTGPVFLA